MTTEIKDDQLDKVIEDSKVDAKSGDELFNKMRRADKDNVPPIHNDKSKVELGELGVFSKVGPEEIDEVFDKVDGIVFKMKKCMFRICYVNKSKRKFTAELINEDPEWNAPAGFDKTKLE